MKKAIGVALLWAIGSWMIGLPVLLGVAGAIGIIAICFFGLYHRLIGTVAALTFIWGLGVLIFGVPNLNDVSDKNWGEIAKTETFIKKGELPLEEKLAELTKLRDAGTITPAEYDNLRAEILTNFTKP